MIKLGDLFDVRYGHSLELNRLRKTSPEKGIPFISRKMGDNGVAAYVERIPNVAPYPGGELTCALSGNGVLSTFIQDQSFYTGYHIACLTPVQKLSRAELLYYCVCIKANRYRFNYGRQANRTIRDILLPAPSEIPNWVQKNDISTYEGADRPLNPSRQADLDPNEWKYFLISDLFDLRKGERLTKSRMVPGCTPFIGAIDSNNGVTGSVGQSALHPGNTITVNYNGNGVAEAFYQPTPFRASDDVNILYPKFPINPYIALFIATIIKKEKYRFNYGRKWHLKRMSASAIKLPATIDGKPDLKFMESYIQSLPFSSSV